MTWGADGRTMNMARPSANWTSTSLYNTWSDVTTSQPAPWPEPPQPNYFFPFDRVVYGSATSMDGFDSLRIADLDSLNVVFSSAVGISFGDGQGAHCAVDCFQIIVHYTNLTTAPTRQPAPTGPTSAEMTNGSPLPRPFPVAAIIAIAIGALFLLLLCFFVFLIMRRNNAHNSSPKSGAGSRSDSMRGGRRGGNAPSLRGSHGSVRMASPFAPAFVAQQPPPQTGYFGGSTASTMLAVYAPALPAMMQQPPSQYGAATPCGANPSSMYSPAYQMNTQLNYASLSY